MGVEMIIGRAGAMYSITGAGSTCSIIRAGAAQVTVGDGDTSSVTGKGAV